MIVSWLNLYFYVSILYIVEQIILIYQKFLEIIHLSLNNVIIITK